MWKTPSSLIMNVLQTTKKTTKNCKTIFTTAKGYHMNANQLTCLEAQKTTKLQTEFLCSVFETKLQMTRSERQAGRQAGRRRSESTTPHPPAQSSSNPHQSSVLANNTHHQIIHPKYSVLTTHHHIIHPKYSVLTTHHHIIHPKYSVFTTPHHIIHPYYGACACLQHPVSCHPSAIIGHVCFNNTHHHHHIIHPQIWWGLTNNPTNISFIHNMVYAAHSPPLHHPSTIWCKVTNNPTIISFVHDMVCANNTHHHIIHPHLTITPNHIIHPQYAFLFEDHASLIVTQQIQIVAIVQINKLFLMRPNTLKTSLINVLFFHHGWQI